MLLAPATLLSMSVTVLIVVFYTYTGFEAGRMRGKHGIKAPACSGHPEFDCAYRVQMNTLEQMVIVLPLLWIAAIYPIRWPLIAPLVGVIWLVARVLYMRGYMAAPEKRELGALVSGVCALALLILAVSGLVVAWIATTA
jgi:glutathione S-transferase